MSDHATPPPPRTPLPPYAFVPGGPWPHPVRDPRGHSHPSHPAAQSPPPTPISTATWPSSREYRRGFDLFNHGYYWEAHEAWEELWHAAGRTGPIADLLKALIKLAAAGVKVREAQHHGVATHAHRASQILANLIRSLQTSVFLGLNLHDLRQRCESLSHHLNLDPGPRDATVFRVFDWILLPLEPPPREIQPPDPAWPANPQAGHHH